MRVARFLLALAVLAPAVAGAAVDSETRAAAGEAQPQVPWRNSMIVYEHATTVRSAVPDWDLTYNPIYVHTLSLRPEWHFSEWFFTRFRFDLEQELTNSDYTTKKNEILWSDLFVEVGTRSFKEPTTGIVLSGTLRLTAPISKVSASRTMLFGVSPGIFLTRSFDVLDGLVLRYAVRYSHRFFRSETGETDGHGIAGCRTPSCEVFLSTGVRNSPWDISHGPLVILIPTRNLTLTTMLSFNRAALYDVADFHLDTGGGLEPVLPSEDDPNARYSRAFLVDLTWTAMPELFVSTGLTTFAPELAPDGTRYPLFFNRHSMVYLSLGVRMDAVLSKL